MPGKREPKRGRERFTEDIGADVVAEKPADGQKGSMPGSAEYDGDEAVSIGFIHISSSEAVGFRW